MVLVPVRTLALALVLVLVAALVPALIQMPVLVPVLVPVPPGPAPLALVLGLALQQQAVRRLPAETTHQSLHEHCPLCRTHCRCSGWLQAIRTLFP